MTENIFIGDFGDLLLLAMIFFLFCTVVIVCLGFYKINNYKKAMELLISRNHRSALNLKQEMLSIVHHLITACYISLTFTMLGSLTVLGVYLLIG